MKEARFAWRDLYDGLFLDDIIFEPFEVDFGQPWHCASCCVYVNFGQAIFIHCLLGEEFVQFKWHCVATFNRFCTALFYNVAHCAFV